MTDPNRIFNAEDEQFLRSVNNIGAAAGSRGSLKISRRRFNESDDTDASAPLPSVFSGPSTSAFSPSTSASSYASTALNSADDIIEVPSHLWSVDSLQFLGFEPAAAASILAKWNGLSQSVRQLTSFIDTVKDVVKYSGINAFTTQDNWDDCLRRLGISVQLRRAILKPGYEPVRYTRSAVDWVHEAIDIRWRHLIHAQEASNRRAYFRAHGPGAGGQSSQATLGATSSIMAGGSQSNVGGSQQRGSSHRQTSSGEFTYNSGAGVVPATKGQIPSTTVIWYSCDRLRAESIWTSSLVPGQFDLTPIIVRPPTDFSGQKAMWYFTPQVEGAQFYLRYLDEIANHLGVCLVRIEVPNSILEARDRMGLYYPSNEFKQVVFFSRRGYALEGRVADNIAASRDFIGHTSRCSHKAYGQMQSWEEIDENNMVVLPGAAPGGRPIYMIQYVFGNDTADLITQQCQHKISFRHGTRVDMVLQRSTAH